MARRRSRAVLAAVVVAVVVAVLAVVAVRLLDDEPTAATPQDSATSDAPASVVAAATPASTPDAYPDADNTGVPPGTELAPYAGPCTITETVVLSAVDATGVCPAIVVQAAGVRIESSRVPRVESTATQVDPTFSVEVVDSEVVAGEWIGGAVWGSNLTVRRTDVTGWAAQRALRHAAAWSRTRGCTTSSTPPGRRRTTTPSSPTAAPTWSCGTTSSTARRAQRHGWRLHGRPLALRRLRTDRRRAWSRTTSSRPTTRRPPTAPTAATRRASPTPRPPAWSSRATSSSAGQRHVRRLRPRHLLRPDGRGQRLAGQHLGRRHRARARVTTSPPWSRRDESRHDLPAWSRRDEVPSRDPPERGTVSNRPQAVVTVGGRR